MHACMFVYPSFNCGAYVAPFGDHYRVWASCCLCRQVDHAYLSRKLKAKQELAAFFQELLQERTRQLIGKAACTPAPTAA